MAEVGMDGAWALADLLTEAGKDKGVPQTVQATVTRVDNEGTAWVHIPGGAEETPINGLNTAEVQPGDIVGVSIAGNQASITGNATAPAASQRAISSAVAPAMEAAQAAQLAAENTEGLAAAAQAVANATGQHFWDDDAGAHVTEVTREEWSDEEGTKYQSGANVLINSIGQLFRNGLTDLLALLPAQKATDTFTGDGSTTSFTLTSMPASVTAVTIDGAATTDYTVTSSVLTFTTAPGDGAVVSIAYKKAMTGLAIFDGNGNEADNISAYFREDGARIGYANREGLTIEGGETIFTDSGGMDAGRISTGGQALKTINRTADGRTLSFPDANPDMANHAVTVGGGTLEYWKGTAAHKTIKLDSATTNSLPYTKEVAFDGDMYCEVTISALAGGGFKVAYYLGSLGMHGSWSGIFTNTTVSWGEWGPAPTYRFGIGATAGDYAFSGGSGVAQGDYSLALGQGTLTTGTGQAALGNFNKQTDYDDYVLMVGNGTDDSSRSNAFAVTYDGGAFAGGRPVIVRGTDGYLYYDDGN